jgi:collagen type VII alpha
LRRTLRSWGRICAAARLLLVMGVCASGCLWGQQATLVADAHVSSAQPGVNSGGLSNLNVGGGYSALLQFDLGMLPAGTLPAQIAKATLRVYCNRADVPEAVQAELVGSGWTEMGVTYATLPTLGAVVQTAQVAGAGTFVTFDVTAVVQGWVVAPGTNFGLALVAGGGGVVQFDSKENDETSHAPELEIALLGSGSGAMGANGPAGVAGPTGAAGAQGIQGETGTAGVTGAVGPAGPQGVPGVSGTGGGLAFVGVYDPVVSYALGSVVQYGGSSWVSLVAGNLGSTPGASGLMWGMLASAGAQGAIGAVGAVGPQGPIGLSLPGPAGAQGLAGPAGLAGATGPQGAQGQSIQGSAGPQGVMGVAGPAGSPGLVYQGLYTPEGNYSLGDVVVFQGSSFVSLTGFNVGQSPGLSPAYWGVLTAQGSPGSTGAQGGAGPQGVQGLLGPVGPPGSTGAQGAQGIPGEAGGQGIPGTTGSTGLSGPMGPQGSAGPVGMSFAGAYASTGNYDVGEGVLWQGAGWVSLIANNHGNTPSLNPADWAMFAASGAPGATGVQGPAGAAGLNGLDGLPGAGGPAGPAGSTGAAGSAGLVYQGAYSSVGNYALGDVVVFAGSSWVSLSAGNVGQTPGVGPGYWGVLTSQGTQGVAGPAGVAGSMGPLGPQGMVGSAGPAGVAGPTGMQGPAGAQGLTGPGGAVGSAGAQGLQGLAGTAGAQGLTGATGAEGLSGPMGPVGAAGPVGMDFAGAYDSTMNYAVGDGVLWQGAGWVSLVASNHGNTPSLRPADWAMFAASGSAGAVGVQGPPGAAGLNGLDGPAGAVGPTGPGGAVGAAGSAGLVYRGTYSSVGNYALGDVVVFAGASWVSLIAGNVGETPGVGSGYWGVLTSVGEQGVAGPVGAAGIQGPVGLQGMVGSAGPSGVAGPIGVQGPAGAQGLTGAAGSVGSAGPQGLTGVSGAAGAQGLTGAAGVEGQQGAAGPVGPVGPVGMSFVGAYASTGNYAVGDGVLWQGAGWVSSIAGNHGNTPSTSPADWEMFSAPGATGATGATGISGVQGPMGSNGLQGPTGATGAVGTQGLQGAQGAAGQQGVQGLAGAEGGQGIPGSTGAEGLQGPVGPTGGVGPVGMSFVGAYASNGNYAVGDGVLWQGAGWVSLIANNVGNTPSASPADWGMFSAPGAVGAVGAAGPQGVAGPSGANGLTGVAGAIGATGAQGLQGMVGAAGPAGVAGPAGTQGPAGAQGLTGATGAAGSAGPQGFAGVAGAAGSQGIPGATGVTGLQGATGATGLAGSVGPAGTNGINGLNGTPGLMWEAAWSSATSYAVNDAVSYAGASYLSLLAGNVGQRPDLYPSAWAVLAQAGDVGAAGPAGVTGAAGIAGPQGATGATGAIGAKGAAGAVGMNFRGVWGAAAEYAVNDSVTFGGATYLAQVAGSNAEPDLYPSDWAVLAQMGGTGAVGAQGVAATVSVGTVSTLAAGSLATVSNSGTVQAAVLNFGIPQGPAGSGSGTGTSSGTFAAMYHAVSYNTLYYAVNSPNASATEAGGAVLAWVPLGCTATELDVYSQQSGAIKVMLRSGSPGTMANTTLSCSPATNGSCTASGAVTIPAGGFIDLVVSAASGTTAGVWTSLQCQ